MDKPGEIAVFVRVVEDGGFSAAARTLGLTPSAVSKLVSRLENRLGVRLMHRTTRAFSLTHEGEVYYQRSARILRDIEDAEEAITRLNEAPRGTLKVNAAVAFATCQVAPLLPEFLALCPDVQVQLTATDRVVDLIEESVDVAIRLGSRTDSSLIARRLVDDQRLICASPEYLRRYGTPRTPSDLAQHNCLTWIGNQGALNDWPFTGPDGVYTLPVQGRCEINAGDTLYELTRAGVGIARMAEFRIATDIRAGRLVPLLSQHHVTDLLPISVLYPHRRHLLPKVRAFVDFLVSKFTPVPPWRTEAVSPPPQSPAESTVRADRAMQ